MSVGLEFSRVLFRSPPHQLLRVEGPRPEAAGPDARPARLRLLLAGLRQPRSGERRVGEEGRCRWDWSSVVCSSALLRINFFEWRGRGQRPLVLMHGLRDYAYYWQDCAN